MWNTVVSWLCKSLGSDDFNIITSEAQHLSREVPILRPSMEVDGHLCFDWKVIRSQGQSTPHPWGEGSSLDCNGMLQSLYSSRYARAVVS